MSLIADWKKIVLKARSVRWAFVAGAFGGAEVILPLFQDSTPRGWFAAASMLAAIGSMVSRVIAQPEMRDGT